MNHTYRTRLFFFVCLFGFDENHFSGTKADCFRAMSSNGSIRILLTWPSHGLPGSRAATGLWFDIQRRHDSDCTLDSHDRPSTDPSITSLRNRPQQSLKNTVRIEIPSCKRFSCVHFLSTMCSFSNVAVDLHVNTERGSVYSHVTEKNTRQSIDVGWTSSVTVKTKHRLPSVNPMPVGIR